MVSVQEQLNAIVGPENVIREEIQLRAYGRSVLVINPEKPAVVTTHPKIVVKPGDVSEVAKIVQFANEFAIPTYISSGGTEISGGTSPVRGGILIDMVRMNKIIAIDNNSLIVTVEAACKLSDLEKKLTDQGLRIGHMPLSIELGVTAAGAASTYGIGAECSGYETLADHVIGMEVVLSSGDVLEIKPTLKSSMGHKTLLWLFLGNEGEHGIITKLTLSARPFDPHNRKTYVFGFSSFESAIRASYKAYRAGVTASMMFAMNRLRATWCLPSLGSLSDVEGLLALEFDGPTGDASTEIEKLAIDLARKADGRVLGKELAREFDENLYAHMDITQVGIMSGQVGSATPSFLDCESAIRWYLDSVRICAEYGVDVLGAAHLGPRHGFISIAHGSFEVGNEEAKMRNVKCRYALIKRALELGGCAESSHGIGLKNAYFMKDDLGAAGLKILQQLKQILDPKDILNPGKRWETAA